MCETMEEYNKEYKKRRHTVKQRIEETRVLLLAELRRITKLLEHTQIRPQDYHSNSAVRAELKGKMSEARRDMKRLEKLLYV